MIQSTNPGSAIQDFRNKSLSGLEQQVPGAPIGPSTTPTAAPTYPTSGPTDAIARNTLATEQQASESHSRIMTAMAQRRNAMRATQGRGMSGGYSQGAVKGMAAAGQGGFGGAYGLQKNAGAALQRLQAAYQQRWGQALPIEEAFRSYQQQAYLYDGWMRRLPGFNLAAAPGTSVHESGRAVDFGGPANGWGEQQSWLAQVGPQYGWSWTGRNFSQVEPWHFEYQGQ